MKPMSLSACSVDDKRPARTSITVTQASELDSVSKIFIWSGHRGDIHHFCNVGMEALERPARPFGVESARRHLMRGEIIEQGARDSRLADAPLVGAHKDDCWSGHAKIL